MSAAPWATFGWWLLAIPVGVAAYAALELFSSWGLSLAFWQRLPSWGRILLLVAIITVAAIGVVFVAEYRRGRDAF